MPHPLTRPLDYGPSDAFSEAVINALIDVIYDVFGSDPASPGGGTGEGLIDNWMIKTGAAIVKEKIADTALVAGNATNAGQQTVSRPTLFTAGAFRLDPVDYSADTVIADGAVTLALANAAKRIQRYNYAATSAVNAVIDTLTGGTVGQIVTIYVNNLDAAQTVSFRHRAGTNNDLANYLVLKNNTTRLIAASTKVLLGTFVFGDLNGSGVNQWWEI